MLIVLDFDDSDLFADVGLEATSGEIVFLASGRYPSRKTAAVLCDDHEAVAVAPGTDGLRYAIYSTMFHRSLFELVVFSSGDPKLSEIASVLNAGPRQCRGVEAVLVARGRVSRRLRLRDLFGAAVAPARLAGILPARPEGAFIDDIDRFLTDDARTTSKPFPNQFVRVHWRQRRLDRTWSVSIGSSSRNSPPAHRVRSMPATAPQIPGAS
jgi:hypothetical protein